LAPKWKTYWRVPGDGGIAPQIEVSGKNVAGHELLYPLPLRMSDEAGETIGYRDKVVFPLRIAPGNAARPVAVDLRAFFGVCEVVCIPAQTEEKVLLAPTASSTADSVLVQEWLSRVPELVADGPVTSVAALEEGGSVKLDVTLKSPVDDLFVLAGERYYVQKPVLADGSARLVVSGARTAAELKASEIRLISTLAGQGLEQVLRII
jgi:suppressor for copper-sensitivity B